MLKTIRIAIAEDHDLLRKGLVSVLGGEPHLEVVFDADNGAEVMEMLRANAVDVLLLDLDMPIMSGVEVLREVRKQNIPVKCIMLSMHYTRYFMMECIAMGASGFLAKNTNVENIIEAIESVHKYGFYMNGDDSTSFLADEMRRSKIQPPKNEGDDFINAVCSGQNLELVATDFNITDQEMITLWRDFQMVLRADH